jgi:uncharacterized protein (TIGR02391 family)
MSMSEIECRSVVDIAKAVSSELAEFGTPVKSVAFDGSSLANENFRLTPDAAILANYDRRILDEDLRAATRSRFVSKHYADSVEAGVKALNECVRKKSGRLEDGDPLMTIAFSSSGGLLRVSKGRSKSDESVQRGHMYLCQGVIGAWRNPRAHALVDDSPERALMMLETINDLIVITKAATRTRKKRV